MRKILLTICAGIFCLAAQAQLITGGQITTTSTYYTSDSAQLQILTNVPAQLTLDGQSMGDVSSQPYRVRYGQHEVMLTADGYRQVKKTVDVQANALNTYRFTLAPGVKRFPVRKGFQQEVALEFAGSGAPSMEKYKGMSYEQKDWSPFLCNLSANYVAGYRFNDWVFLGVGTGLQGYSQTIAVEDDWQSHLYYPCQEDTHLSYQYIGKSRPSNAIVCKSRLSVEIPLYAQLKVYFLNTRCKPFFLTSLGGRFGLNKYHDMGLLFNCGLGVEYAISERYAVNFSLGYHLRQQISGYNERSVGSRTYDSYSCINGCPYYREFHYHFSVYEVELGTNYELHGFFVRAGFVF